MTVDFLGKEVELKVLSLGHYDEVQDILLGDANIAAGSKDAKVSMKKFKEHMYTMIEYGTKDPKITVKYLRTELTSKDSSAVQELFEAIKQFNEK